MSEKQTKNIMDLLDKVMDAKIAADPHPEKILAAGLDDIQARFMPKNIEQARAYANEFLAAASLAEAFDNIEHIKAHPERAEVCVVRGTQGVARLFERSVQESTARLCKELGLDNPFEETINARTRKEILAELEREQSS